MLEYLRQEDSKLRRQLMEEIESDSKFTFKKFVKILEFLALCEN